MNRNKMLALSQAVQSHMHGAPVVAYEPIVPPANDDEPTDMDDCVLMYEGADVIPMFPEIDTPCDKSAFGQCEMTITDPDHCRFCGRYV